MGLPSARPGKPLVRLALPDQVSINGLLDGQLDLHDPTVLGVRRVYRPGSVLAFTPEALNRAAAAAVRLGECAHLVFEPNARQTVDQVAVTRDRVEAAIYDNVRGGLLAFRRVRRPGLGESRPARPGQFVCRPRHRQRSR